MGDSPRLSWAVTPRYVKSSIISHFAFPSPSLFSRYINDFGLAEALSLAYHRIKSEILLK